MPTSLPVAGLKLIVLLILAVVCLAVFILLQGAMFIGFACSWICGFRPRSWFIFVFAEEKSAPDVPKDKFLLPYKKKLVKKPDRDWYSLKDVRFAPYQFIIPIATVGLAIFVLSEFSFFSSTTSNAVDFALIVAPYVALGIGVLAVLTTLGYIFKHWIVPILKRKYVQWCPPIEWVDETVEAAEAA